MPVELFEGVIEATRTALRTSLPAAIDALNAEFGDGIVLAKPISNVGGADDGYVIAAEAGTPTPYVEIGAPDFVLHSREVGGVHVEADEVVAVRLLCVDPVSSAILYRRSMRYAAAILRVLLQPNAFGPGVNVREENSVRGAFRWGREAVPPDSPQNPQVTGGVLLVFYLEAVETVIG